MAVTRIWAIKGYVGDVIRYAANKEKTDFNKLTEEQKALYRSLHYAGNEEKTTLDTEQIRLVEGINCDPEIAAEQMMNTKELYGKTDGIVAYHGYISFKPGEVEPEEAQRIAMEVANKMWGADYEIIVATHMNAHCVHCHLVTNSVSMTDGKKMNENKAMYQKFRQTSDAVCLEHGLSIIQNPRGKRVPYNVYKAQQKGIKTKYDHIREDIDSAISHSPDIRYFLADMVSNGYDMSNFYDQNKYATIRHKSDEHGIRLVNLGEQYTPAAIQYRINYRDKKSRWSDYYSNNYRNYNLRERFMVFHFKGAEFYESNRAVLLQL